MPCTRAELGAFLRSRRDALTPERAGVPAVPGPRRVPVLRKEELAARAGVSPDYVEFLRPATDPEQQLATYTALPGSRTARALALLAEGPAAPVALTDDDAARG